MVRAMNDLPEDSEAITALLQGAAERIRGELAAEIGMVIANERDQKVIIAKIGEVYDRLLAPLIRDLVLVEMRLTSQLDQVGKMLEEMDKKDEASASDSEPNE